MQKKEIDAGMAARESTRQHADPLTTLIVPVYNESSVIDSFVQRVEHVLRGNDIRFELLFVDDGSNDRTFDQLITARRHLPEMSVLRLSRNFGKEAALSAGLDHARGDVVIPIDVDLQDPPEVIPEFIEKWREGFDVVYGVRSSRTSDTRLKRMSAAWFYRIFNGLSRERIPFNAGDFRLLDRKVVNALRSLPENNRFMKGLFGWVGFRSIGVPFERESRASGRSNWNYWRLWNFALDGFIGFSTVPLRLWLYVGFVISFLSFLYALVIVLRVLIYGIDVPGYASLITVVLFLGGVQLLSLGTIGEYLARLFNEAKRRPVYIIDEFLECAAREDRVMESNGSPSTAVSSSDPEKVKGA